jgi:hypothetical protein
MRIKRRPVAWIRATDEGTQRSMCWLDLFHHGYGIGASAGIEDSDETRRWARRLWAKDPDFREAHAVVAEEFEMGACLIPVVSWIWRCAHLLLDLCDSPADPISPESQTMWR